MWSEIWLINEAPITPIANSFTWENYGTIPGLSWEGIYVSSLCRICPDIVDIVTMIYGKLSESYIIPSWILIQLKNTFHIKYMLSEIKPKFSTNIFRTLKLFSFALTSSRIQKILSAILAGLQVVLLPVWHMASDSQLPRISWQKIFWPTPMASSIWSSALRFWIGTSLCDLWSACCQDGLTRWRWRRGKHTRRNGKFLPGTIWVLRRSLRASPPCLVSSNPYCPLTTTRSN